MRRELEGSMVFDTGILLELIYSTEKGRKLKEALKSERILGNTSEVNIAETRYVLCRRIGENESRRRVDALISSGYIVLHGISGLVDYASQYKCKRSISLADCFTLALAKKMDVPAVFARREEELLREMLRERFDVEILFLEDIA
jgi:predicted nucleic acid-binding protein